VTGNLHASNGGPRSLANRKSVTARLLVVAFATYAGETIRRLRDEEKRLRRDFFAPDTTIEQRVALVRALDTLRDRRRVTLGIPLPNGPQRRTLNLPPEGPVDVDLLPEGTTTGYNGDSTHTQVAEANPVA